MSLKEKLLSLNIVEDNEYLDRYVELIESNKFTKKEKFKTHKHHIIPKYYYKSNKIDIDNSKDNIVNLNIKDHILVHSLLIKCGKDAGFILSNIHAFNLLTRKQGHRLNEDELKKILEESENIEILRLKTISKISKEKNSGGKYVYKDNVVRHIKGDEVDNYLMNGWKLGNPNATHKDRSKRRYITNGTTFKLVHLDELNSYLESGWYFGGHKPSLNTRLKISKGAKGHRCNTKNKIVITDGYVNKFINKEDFAEYSLIGWRLGSKPRKDDFKKKISDNIRGRIHINNGQESKMIYETDLNKYLNNGWIRGRLSWRKK